MHRFCSSFGQNNLETSNYVWEKCFAVLISLFGLLLFTYFIGNLEVGLNSIFFKGLGFLLPSYTIMNWTLLKNKEWALDWLLGWKNDTPHTCYVLKWPNCCTVSLWCLFIIKIIFFSLLSKLFLLYIKLLWSLIDTS